VFEQITKSDQILAIIIKNDYSNKGISFFTPDDFSQQLAYMNHFKGDIIQPHIHNIVKREILDTKEIIFIKKGKIRVDFYSDKNIYFCSRILETGDIILLASGGHGFEMLEDTEMFEVKQGPYAGANDKIRFEGITKKENLIYNA